MCSSIVNLSYCIINGWFSINT
uniref:Uncharacterized protein n=1 Tax=Rhizophora mucronata TaxID=61149 RepID=A0A2P2N3X8_RHIMU